MHAIRRFYYDTALSPSPYALAALRELVDPSHILFGSDLPFAPALVTGMQVKDLGASTVIDAATKAAINRANALALFPCLRLDDEAGDLADSQPGLGESLKRAALEPVVDVVDRIRDR